MTAANRTPTTRILTLAAIIIAAGVLSFRALDLFASPAAPINGSALEQRAINLLEPLIGNNAVRVSIAGTEGRTILILLDGPAENLDPSLKANIEVILTASVGYGAPRDTLTIKQFPFAAGTGTRLSPLQMAEFTGLGLLCMTLLASLMLQNRSATPAEMQPSQLPAKRASRPQQPEQASTLASPDIAKAADMAERNPSDTVHILRNWMTGSEDAA
ncbi:MAG: hypothetical protein ABNH53_03015 [Henriciella sp.]|jgi:flagellar biosynthesis/type III secretory pathway M-ring protein FliF/YscJ